MLSPRSGRKHKAWGASPRITNQKHIEAREAVDSPEMAHAVARFTGSKIICLVILGIAPQALCLHPLRGLCAPRLYAYTRFAGYAPPGFMLTPASRAMRPQA